MSEPMVKRGFSDAKGSWKTIWTRWRTDRKSTRLNSSHSQISYAVFCLKKKKPQTRSLATQIPWNDGPLGNHQPRLIECCTVSRFRSRRSDLPPPLFRSSYGCRQHLMLT